MKDIHVYIRRNIHRYIDLKLDNIHLENIFRLFQTQRDFAINSVSSTKA